MLQVKRGLDAQYFVNGVGEAAGELFFPAKGVALVLLIEVASKAFLCARLEAPTHDGTPVQRDELVINLVAELCEVIAEFGVVLVLRSVDTIGPLNAVFGESNRVFNLSGVLLLVTAL